ncbi:MAG: sigma factor [Chloroflexota bacterium]
MLIEQFEYELMSDDDLALAARRGDIPARNALYLRHRDLISRRIAPATRLARNLAASGAPIDARDVEQEAFIRFCDLIDEWDPTRARFVPFMAAMIWRRTCKYVRQYEHLRSRHIRVVPLSRIPDAWRGPEKGARNAEGELFDILRTPQSGIFNESGEEAFDEDLNWESLVGTLRVDWKRFVRRRFWDDESCRHIAYREGCSPRTINRGLSAALKQLRCQLDEEKEAV